MVEAAQPAHVSVGLEVLLGRDFVSQGGASVSSNYSSYGDH